MGSCYRLIGIARCWTWYVACTCLCAMLLSSCAWIGSGRSDKTLPTTGLATRRTEHPTGTRVFMDTWDGIHLFQSFAYNIANPAAVAKDYDFVWGAAPNQVAAFRQGNPAISLSYYFPFHRDFGTYADTDLGRTHSLSYWQARHPDWILYQCDRRTPAREDAATAPNIGFDFTNPAVINWQIQTYADPASAGGYDALAADNLNLENQIGACGFYRDGHWVQRYTGNPDDPQWRKDVLFWVSTMQQRLHALPHPLLLIPNLGLNGLSPQDPVVQAITQHIDGVLDESGFTSYGDSPVTGNSWLQLVQFMQMIQQQGKAYYLVNEYETPTISSDQLQWALASYLMGKEHSASVFIARDQQYGSVLLYPAYHVDIGSPLGEPYQAQNVYWRSYSGGLVVVNPAASTTCTISTGAQAYRDIAGSTLPTTIRLAPHTGMLLLRA